ncbi:potassium-transporting ATPase subunit F [Pseudogulbenkiania subflava]|nr:potassium-transporting ATPase subunit F [Pseudogulbenkiania subflava]
MNTLYALAGLIAVLLLVYLLYVLLNAENLA